MSDPRLCSIHLEALPRRDDFRRAREALLNTCGQQTLAGVRDDVGNWSIKSPHTLIQNENSPPASEYQFMVMDKDFTYPLRTGLNTIGRLNDNDIVIDDACVSRRHCAIVVHHNDWCEVHDVASKNGTYVNGRRINGPTRLSPGDEIRMCNRQLVFATKDHAAGKGPSPDQAITRGE